MSKPPLILTLLIEEEKFEFFNTLRKQHFPLLRNFIDAHLTLFHALPNESRIFDDVKALCERQQCFDLLVREVVSIGNGVAFKLESVELAVLHKNLQLRWRDDLSPQDRQKLWPHITVQNKVPAATARELLHHLQDGFTAFTVMARGLQVWEYLGGPWKPAEEFTFQETS